MCKQEKDEKILLYYTTTHILRRSSLASLSHYPPTNLERIKFPRHASEVSITLNGGVYRKVKLGLWARAGRLLGIYKEFLVVWGNEERKVKEPEKLWLRSMRIVTGKKREIKDKDRDGGLTVVEEIENNGDLYMEKLHEQHDVWSCC